MLIRLCSGLVRVHLCVQWAGLCGRRHVSRARVGVPVDMHVGGDPILGWDRTLGHDTRRRLAAGRVRVSLRSGPAATTATGPTPGCSTPSLPHLSGDRPRRGLMRRIARETPPGIAAALVTAAPGPDAGAARRTGQRWRRGPGVSRLLVGAVPAGGRGPCRAGGARGCAPHRAPPACSEFRSPVWRQAGRGPIQHAGVLGHTDGAPGARACSMPAWPLPPGPTASGGAGGRRRAAPRLPRPGGPASKTRHRASMALRMTRLAWGGRASRKTSDSA